MVGLELESLARQGIGDLWFYREGSSVRERSQGAYLQLLSRYPVVGIAYNCDVVARSGIVVGTVGTGCPLDGSAG